MMKNTILIFFTFLTITSTAQEKNGPFSFNNIFFKRKYAIKIELGYSYLNSLGHFQLADNYFSSSILTLSSNDLFLYFEFKYCNTSADYGYYFLYTGFGYSIRLKKSLSIELKIGSIATDYFIKDYDILNSGFAIGLKLNKDFILSDRSKINVGLEFDYYNINNDSNKFINSNDFLNGMVTVGYKYIFKKAKVEQSIENPRSTKD